MATQPRIDRKDVICAAEKLAGNWRNFDSFSWSRGYDLEDADSWFIFYTSNRDSGLLDLSNEKSIREHLKPFTEGDDPDVVAETHGHWAVGQVDGFSVRVRNSEGTVTQAFGEYCRIRQALDDYPVLNEDDYSDRAYDATLENYRGEMWPLRDELPEGWEGKVYSWFNDNDHEEFTENTDDRGGWAGEEEIVVALHALDLHPSQEDQPIIVTVAEG